MSDTVNRRGLSVGLMLCVMAISFESYAVLTAMPAAKAPNCISKPV